jgi:hypothetical protein
MQFWWLILIILCENFWLLINALNATRGLLVRLYYCDIFCTFAKLNFYFSKQTIAI